MRTSNVSDGESISEIAESELIQFFLLAEAARSECAPSMRAVKDSLTAPLRAKWGKSEGPRPG
jgi:hypothetical protein